MHRDDLPIAEPCGADWNGMEGGDRRRFCSACTKHVHDLSAMTESEATALLAEESRPCVRYEVLPDGRIRHHAARAAAVAAVLLSATPAVADPPKAEVPPPQTVVRPIEPDVVIMGELAPPTPQPPILMGRVAVHPHDPPPPIDPIRVLPTLPEPAKGQTVIPEVEAVLEEQRRK